MEDSPDRPLFRPSKRRKLHRKPHTQDATDLSKPPVNLSGESSVMEVNAPQQVVVDDDDGSIPERSVAELIRIRKLGKTFKSGISFSNSNKTRGIASGVLDEQDGLGRVDENQVAIDAALNRFAPQTGQIAELVDKHMMAYIDNHIAQIRHGETQADSRSAAVSTEQEVSINSASGIPAPRQPATLGKLHEIDLGPRAALDNIARTQAATKKLEGGASDTDDGSLNKNVRLGRDGKPRKNRNRRNSEDIRRDKLVEEILKETRLDIYEEPTQPAVADVDQAADDQIAEQFRREFMEAVSSRHIRRSAPAPASANKKAVKDSKSKGPKLGGSRSARAAMRAQEEAMKKKK